MTINLDTLRKTAEAPGVTPGPWEVWKNVHCDPVVVPAGKPWAGITDPKMPFEKVAGLSTAPDDYGRANLEYIATFDPPTVLRLLDLAESEAEYAELNPKLSAILLATANALKGEPEPLTAHSWHDLAEVAAQLVSRLEQAEQAVQRVREVIRQYDPDHLTCMCKWDDDCCKCTVADFQEALDGDSNE